MSTDIANRQPRVFVLALAALAMAGFATAARANLVSNGSFETFSGSGATCPTGQTQQLTNTNLSGWTPETTNNYSFVLNTGNAGNFANSTNGGSGSCIGLQPVVTASPDGGNFIATDASFQNPGPFTFATTVAGLVTGATYTLTFDMAAGQQKNFSGPSSDTWKVGLTDTAGVGASQTTPAINLPNGGFSGWVGESMQFVAGGISQMLWFMGGSTAASGQPPFVLLDGVNMSLTNTPVPEPPAYAMLMAGLLALMGVRYVYRRKG